MSILILAIRGLCGKYAAAIQKESQFFLLRFFLQMRYYFDSCTLLYSETQVESFYLNVNVMVLELSTFPPLQLAHTRLSLSLVQDSPTSRFSKDHAMQAQTTRPFDAKYASRATRRFSFSHADMPVSAGAAPRSSSSVPSAAPASRSMSACFYDPPVLLSFASA